MTTDEVETKTLSLMSGQPSCRLALYRILDYCRTPRSAPEIEQAMLAFPEIKASIYPPLTLLSWLTETGAIDPITPADPEAEEEEVRWQTTEAGKAVAEREAPARRLLELLDSEPHYRDIYLQVLRFCETPRSRVEIEEMLKDSPLLVSPKVYPMFFIGRLEETGALEWVGKWQTTDVGKGVMVMK